MHIFIPVLHRPIKPTGVCRHAANLAKCLAETDEVTQVTLLMGDWQKKYFEETFQLFSSKINNIGVLIDNNSFSRNYWYLFRLPQFATLLNPDIIHLPFPFPFVRQWFNVPVVATIHDLYPYECPENFGYPQVLFNRWFLRQCVDQSDGLSCVSQATLRSLQEYFPNINTYKKITAIYNYVDFSNVSPKPPKIIVDGKYFKFIFCVGQHRKNKNLDLLIHAYYILQKSSVLQSTTKLLIVGSPGPETENIKHQIQNLALQNQVILLSSIDDGELYWLYQHCEVFAIPSSTEGFCFPLVEALSLSPRVVCSNIPIFQEVGSLKCHYFELGDKIMDNLTEALTFSLSKPPINSLSLDLRFSKTSVAQQLLSFYCSVR